MSKFKLSRRSFLTGAAIGSSGLLLASCNVLDGLDRDSGVRNVLESANNLTYRIQRTLADRNALAEEFSEQDIRQPQRPNGSTDPDDEDYKQLASDNFAK